tara:strand:- start:336 stop:473 length:138 start_codon:yes stop_codon:yes gene_type:complete
MLSGTATPVALLRDALTVLLDSLGELVKKHTKTTIKNVFPLSTNI